MMTRMALEVEGGVRGDADERNDCFWGKNCYKIVFE